MLQMLKLLPEQISRHWDIISFAIEQSAGPVMDIDENALIKYAEACISGQVQTWAINNLEDGNASLIAFLFTSIITEAITKEKVLNLIGIYAFDMAAATNMQIWRDSLDKLRTFAKAQGCKTITFYTDSAALLRMTKELGFTTNLTFGKLSVT